MVQRRIKVSQLGSAVVPGAGPLGNFPRTDHAAASVERPD